MFRVPTKFRHGNPNIGYLKTNILRKIILHNFIIEAAVSTPVQASWAARESPVNGTEHGKYFWPVFCDLNLEKVSLGDSSWEVFSATRQAADNKYDYQTRAGD